MSPSRRAALVSLAAAIFLVAIKLVVGLATGSLGVLAEAVHSAADSFAALLTLYAVTVAERPADRSHQYGHGKAQNLGALAEALLLVGAAVWIAVTAIGRLGDSTGPHSAGIGIALMLFVLVVDASRAVVARRTARSEHSAALYASSWHFATDFAGSLAVLVGLVLAALGYPGGDAIAALVVAGIILVVAVSLAVRNVESLMDVAPRGLDERIIDAALSVPGVEEVRSVRVRESGGEVFADVVIGVPRLRGLERSHETTDAVEQAIEHAVEQTSGRTSVTVHVEPTDRGERDAERVAAAALRVPGVMEVHNIAVLADGERREVTLHARVAEEETLGGVEQTLTRLRAEISHDLAAGDVHIHLEPFAPEAQEAQEVTAIESELAARATRAAELAASAPCLVELWRQDRRLVAVCALEADPALTVRRGARPRGARRGCGARGGSHPRRRDRGGLRAGVGHDVIVERAPAAELIPRPLELLDAAIGEGRPLGTWTRPNEGCARARLGPAASRGLGASRGAAARAPGHRGRSRALRRGLPDARHRPAAGRCARARRRHGELSLARRPPRLGARRSWASGGISLVEPLALRRLDEAAREAGRIACFAGLGPYELLDADGRKLVGLAQRRRRGGVLLQAAAYLAGTREPLADMLWLAEGERRGLKARLAGDGGARAGGAAAPRGARARLGGLEPAVQAGSARPLAKGPG